MRVYIFGNQDVSEDNLVFDVVNKLNGKFKDIEFITVKPNEDVPFVSEKSVVIMDTVVGIDKVEVIEDKDLDKLVLSPRNSAHDFDLGFQLKYLKKLGKLDKVIIIGLPQQGEIDYLRIQSILRKLVAQDIQGS
ncbi:MAG: hypothetical protein A2905_04545 [Candidatus Levybacteria bacterium RIFCSPLOWO2_01_FULL_36_10]|nr:MAG: hypothetical protein A2905_04545 [Candidatus Levybacteria bacterium RIFCSPLOWO2_01_FULL_36_10]